MPTLPWKSEEKVSFEPDTIKILMIFWFCGDQCINNCEALEYDSEENL